MKGVGTVIEAVGAALVCLSPYSPDLNPIEQVFAKLKAPLRKVAGGAISGVFFHWKKAPGVGQ